MFKVEGKYNYAWVMLDALDDPATLSQIHSFLNHPAMKGEPVSIMPDTHAGSGAVIGFTMPLNNYVIPNVVGVDIGCGVDTYKIGKKRPDFELLDRFIRAEIPSGFKIRKESVLKDKNMACRFSPAETGLMENLIRDVAITTGQEYGYALNSLGTLGGGNHFIEVGMDEEEAYWLAIHSGSRHFGLKIAEHHQAIAKQLNADIDGAPRQKGLEFLPMEEGGAKYLSDMRVAQAYAAVNRKIMAMIIIERFLLLKYAEVEKISSVHNFIDFEDNIIRKGAIRAYTGEKLVIPFNMEDGFIIGTGKSSPEWNYSAPHGAGRILSRRKAKETLNLESALESMRKKGIYTTSLNRSSLDEAKNAYKSKDMILEMMKPSVNVEKFVRPVYNFKSSS